jgi:predicted nuclease of predicted toxin-antitoxin system
MALRFFADHCISNFIIKTLQDAGNEVFRLRDYISTDSADQIVISKAQELNSILISLNGDFADIVSYPPANFKGIISLQVKIIQKSFHSLLQEWKIICVPIPV